MEEKPIINPDDQASIDLAETALQAPFEPYLQHNRRRSTLVQYLGAVLWPAFLAASAATFFFFAMFDPVALGPVTAWQIELGREMGYTLGFLLFWLLTAGCSASTAWLIYGFKSSTHAGAALQDSESALFDGISKR